MGRNCQQKKLGDKKNVEHEYRMGATEVQKKQKNSVLIYWPIANYINIFFLFLLDF